MCGGFGSQPGFAAGFAGSRNGVEAPGALARGGIVGVDETADAVFAARDADDDFVFDDQGSDGEGIALRVVGGLNIPKNIAGGGVESDDVSIEGSEKESRAEDGEAAIGVSTAGAKFFRQRALVRPDAPAGAGVKGEGEIFRER